MIAEARAKGLPLSTAARTEMAAENHALAVFLATRKWRALGQPPDLLEDMIGCAYVGLCEAARTFDPSKGFKLSTWATRCIKWAISDGFRNLDHLTRYHRAAIRSGRALPISVLSLSHPLARSHDNATSREDLSLEDAIEDTRVTGPATAAHRRVLLEDALRGSSPLHRRLLHMHYIEEMSNVRMAIAEGMSPSFISQHLQAAIAFVRERAKSLNVMEKDVT